jgi:uncharacterized integral membrane protein (TIGR00697 family)
MNEQELLREISYDNQNLKYFHIFSAIYVASVLTSLLVSARLFPFHIPFTNFTILLTGGTWTIPITFFIQDITTEVYGFVKSKQLVLMNIPIIIISIIYLKCTTFFPIPTVNNIDEAYNIVLDAIPRHLLALLAAILIGNLVNNFLLAHLKRRFKGAYLPWRFIGSTAIGEAALQLVGTSVAWVGVLSFSNQILPFIIFSYGYKVAFEAAMSPINIYLCRWLKKAERVDVYDV